MEAGGEDLHNLHLNRREEDGEDDGDMVMMMVMRMVMIVMIKTAMMMMHIMWKKEDARICIAFCISSGRTRRKANETGLVENRSDRDTEGWQQ